VNALYYVSIKNEKTSASIKALVTVPARGSRAGEQLELEAKLNTSLVPGWEFSRAERVCETSDEVCWEA